MVDDLAITPFHITHMPYGGTATFAEQYFVLRLCCNHCNCSNILIQDT